MTHNNGAAANVMACVYGKPKKKKTSDALAAFPRALCIGVPSALALVAENELGFTPAIHPEPPQTLTDLIVLLRQLASDGNLGQYGAVIIDDTSHLCRRSQLYWEENAPSGRSGKRDRFYPYQMLSKTLLQLAGDARHLGVHLCMTFHERPPGHNADGAFCPGGPDVPSRNQIEVLPSWCDINVRALIDEGYPDPWFPSVYYCDPTDSDWVTGDRTGVCYAKTPGNLREILRASNSGYQLARLPGLEWQDDIAEQVALEVAGGNDVRETIKSVAASASDAHQLHLRWACQDGIARGVLRLRAARGLFDFDATKLEATNESQGSGPSLPPPPPTT